MYGSLAYRPPPAQQREKRILYEETLFRGRTHDMRRTDDLRVMENWI
jgi:hypothetical protein